MDCRCMQHEPILQGKAHVQAKKTESGNLSAQKAPFNLRIQNKWTCNNATGSKKIDEG